MFRHCLRTVGLMFVAVGLMTILAPPASGVAAVLVVLGVGMLAVCAIISLLAHLFRGTARVMRAALPAVPRIHMPHLRAHPRPRHIH